MGQRPQKSGNGHMKRCSASQIVRERQIKNTMRHRLSSVRMVIIKKRSHYKCWWGCGEKGSPVPCWSVCKWVQSLCKTVRRFCRHLKIELPYDGAIPLLCVYHTFNRQGCWTFYFDIVLSSSTLVFKIIYNLTIPNTIDLVIYRFPPPFLMRSIFPLPFCLNFPLPPFLKTPASLTHFNNLVCIIP